MTELIWSDRYGGNYPDPEACCPVCDGMGTYPTWPDENNFERQVIGTFDNVKFVECERCNGSGEIKEQPTG